MIIPKGATKADSDHIWICESCTKGHAPFIPKMNERKQQKPTVKGKGTGKK